MADKARKPPDWGPPARTVTDSMMAGVGSVIDEAGKTMLKNAKPVTRYMVSKIPGAPGLVIDAVELGQAKDKPRKVFSMVGGALGGMAGGALGAATGPAAPVGIPIGVTVGSVAGQHIAEEVYDDNIDAVRDRMAQTKAWMRERQDALARSANEMVGARLPPAVRPFVH